MLRQLIHAGGPVVASLACGIGMYCEAKKGGVDAQNSLESSVRASIGGVSSNCNQVMRMKHRAHI